MVTLADKAPPRYIEQPLRRVTELLHRAFQREDPLLHQFQHRHERMLDQRTAGRTGCVGPCLLLERVGRVIRGDHIDAIIVHGLSDGRAILVRLHRRVPLDQCPFFRIVRIGEPEVVHAGFGRDPLVLQRPRLEQSRFPRRADVKDVQPGALFPGQCHGTTAAEVAGFRTADPRMLLDGDRVTPTLHGARRVGPDSPFVLGVYREQHVRFLEDSAQCIGIVHQHVARAGTEEGLQAAHVARIRAQHLGEVVVAHTHVERIVHHGRLFRDPVFRFQQILGQRVRYRIGHLHETGDAPCSGSGGGMGDVVLVREARLPEMHLVIDHTGKEQAPPGIDLLHPTR